ncbi:MAG: HAMP domain-containing protein, partial [Nitrospira sp.]|nr:HAMP domain-containing protein [Nitrospira sp.]
MTKKRGGIQRKLVISMLIVGLLSCAVAFFLTYLDESRAVWESVGSVFKNHVLVGEIPEAAYHPEYSSVWKILILGPAGLGILLLLSYLAARWISVPIRELSSGVDRMMGQGQLGHNIRIKTGDEIEKIAESFNQMSKELEDKFNVIQSERDKLNTVMDSLGDGLIILDESYKIEYINAKFLELYGTESLGKYCYEVFGVGDIPCKGCSVNHKEDSKPHTIEAVTNKGFTYLITHSPIKNIDGSTSIVEIFRDITPRKRLEQQLLYSERLTALSQFSSTLAHDLRNPIIAIKKTLEMLKKTTGIKEEAAVKEVYVDLIA